LIASLLFCFFGAAGTMQWSADVFLNSTSSVVFNATVMSIVIMFLVSNWFEGQQVNKTDADTDVGASVATADDKKLPSTQDLVILFSWLVTFSICLWWQSPWMLLILVTGMQFFVLGDSVVASLTYRPATTKCS
jgi:hypothetical protein